MAVIFWFSGSRVHVMEYSMDGALVNIRKKQVAALYYIEGSV